MSYIPIIMGVLLSTLCFLDPMEFLFMPEVKCSVIKHKLFFMALFYMGAVDFLIIAFLLSIANISSCTCF